MTFYAFSPFYTELLLFYDFSVIQIQPDILHLEENSGWMHETRARAWCTGKTQRNQMEREVGGGIGMGNICKSMADSCQCMTKTTTIL